MRLLRMFMLLLLCGVSIGAVAGATSQRTFLPLLRTTGTPPQPTAAYRVNVPAFPTADLSERFSELAIFWFGQVNQTSNYADVRVGSNATELYVHVAVFDRRLWYSTNPTPADLTNWDALSLYVADPQAPQQPPHRFVAQLHNNEGNTYQAAYRATTAGWVLAPTPFTSIPGWRGERLNDDTDDRGWAMAFRIPFSSLGLERAPAPGTRWQLGLTLHDRDSRAGPPNPNQHWPPAFDPAQTSTWGELHFGIPTAPAPDLQQATTTITLRHGLNGLNVTDVAVGGGATCGDGLDFWRAWGDSTRDAGRSDFNIQNQSDIADWPCFAKYYVTFPLDSLPAGRTIVSAELILHQFGNAQPADAQPSLIQLHIVDQDWQEADLTWNNAPLARENVGAAWVDPLPGFPGWPGVPRSFDATRAVRHAYTAGEPLRLALYSADSAYHSGKYFVSSDTEDWNAVARPTLRITLR